MAASDSRVVPGGTRWRAAASNDPSRKPCRVTAMRSSGGGAPGSGVARGGALASGVSGDGASGSGVSGDGAPASDASGSGTSGGEDAGAKSGELSASACAPVDAADGARCVGGAGLSSVHLHRQHPYRRDWVGAPAYVMQAAETR